jgi:hypothetical protein
MHSFFSALLFLTLLVTYAAAAPRPSSEVQKRGVFKVERVKNVNFVKHNGAVQYSKALRKYSMPFPPELAALQTRKIHSLAAANASVAATNTSAAAAGTGLVAATPEKGDSEYLAPINIGGQTMNMDFDSGSSDLWVFSTQLATASQTGHQNFDATKSKTFAVMQGASWSISYGDGSGAAGTVGTDTVNIGGATVTKQAVELATAVSASFVSDTQSNGLVGLAYSKLNTVKPTQQKTFFDNAIPALNQPVFTADLKHATAGSYEFGNIDATKFNGSLSWAAINTTNGFWQFSSQKFQVGTSAAQTATGGQAIADTGTTLMIVDTAVANAYYSQVTGAANNAQAGGITFPCDSKLPDLSVDIGGNYMATIPGNLINFTNVDATSMFSSSFLSLPSTNLQ